MKENDWPPPLSQTPLIIFVSQETTILWKDTDFQVWKKVRWIPEYNRNLTKNVLNKSIFLVICFHIGLQSATKVEDEMRTYKSCLDDAFRDRVALIQPILTWMI